MIQLTNANKHSNSKSIADKMRIRLALTKKMRNIHLPKGSRQKEKREYFMTLSQFHLAPTHPT